MGVGRKEPDVTRKKHYQPGDIVWAQGCETGNWYECRVIERCNQVLSPGDYLLDSPAHGYAIQRHYSEMRRTPV